MAAPRTSQWTITACHQTQGWNLNRYESFKVDKNSLCYGVPIILRNKLTGCSLSVNCGSDKSGTEQIEKSRVYLSSSEQDVNRYWIFENKDCMRGGKINDDSPVYIRNATLSGYLTCDLRLSDVPTADFKIAVTSLSQLECI